MTAVTAGDKLWTKPARDTHVRLLCRIAWGSPGTVLAGVYVRSAEEKVQYYWIAVTVAVLAAVFGLIGADAGTAFRAAEAAERPAADDKGIGSKLDVAAVALAHRSSPPVW